MPGANHTKMALAQSLQDLMNTMPLEKISVNDIVEHAGMGRNTFYYHFEDKYDLVNWYFQTGMTHFLASRMNFGSWEDMLNSAEEYFRENRVFYTNALSYTGQNSLRSYIFDFVREIFAQRAQDCTAQEQDPLSSADLRFLGDFLAGGLMGILQQWVDHGMKEHITDYYHGMQRICSTPLLQQFFQLEDEELAHPGHVVPGDASAE